MWVQSFGDVVKDMKLGTLFVANQPGSLPDNTGEIDPLEATGGTVNHASFSADGRVALLAAADRSVRVHEVEGRRDVKRLVGHVGSVWCSALSADGKTALSGGMDGTVRSWNAAEGSSVHAMTGHVGLVSCVALSRDGTKAVSGGYDGAAVLWDLKDGKELRRLDDAGKYVTAAAISPDGTAALIAADKKLFAWNLADGKRGQPLEGHAFPVTCIAYSADGTKALTGDDGGSTKLWDLAAGKAEKTFLGHAGPVRSASLMSNGKWVLTGGADSTLRLWKVADASEAAVFKQHAEPVVGAAFADNNRQTVSAGRDGAVKVWDIAKFLPAPPVPKKEPDSVAPELPPLKPDKVVPLDGTIASLIVSPNGKWVYALDLSNARLAKIDTATAKIATQLETTGQAACLSAGGKTLYVLDGDALHVVDALALKRRKTIALEAAGIDVAAVGDAGATVTDAAGGRLSVVVADDLVTRLPEEPAKSVTKPKPVYLATASFETTSYAATPTGWLKEFTTPDWKEGRKWKLPATAYRMAYDGKGSKLYLAVVDPQAMLERPRAKGFGDIWVIDLKSLPK